MHWTVCSRGGCENIERLVSLIFLLTVTVKKPGVVDFDKIEVDQFVDESLKMSRFKHSHVMGLIGVCLDTGSAPFIIMPYMANGSLLKYLKRERGKIVLSDENDEDEVSVEYFVTYQ